MMKLADMRDLGSRALRRWGSSPHARTKNKAICQRQMVLFLGSAPCGRSTPRGSNMLGASELPLRQDFAAQNTCGNVKKCAVGKHPKSEKHGNTAQFSEVERSGTQENCGGIGSGCRLRLRPLPVLRRRQSQRVARIDPNAVVVDKNIAENDRFDLFSR